MGMGMVLRVCMDMGFGMKVYRAHDSGKLRLVGKPILFIQFV